MFVQELDDLVAELRADPTKDMTWEGSQAILRRLRSATSAGGRLTEVFEASWALAISRVLRSNALSDGDLSFMERETTTMREALIHVDRAADAAMDGQGADLEIHLRAAVSVLASPEERTGEPPVEVIAELTDAIDSAQETFADEEARSYVQRWLAKKADWYAQSKAERTAAASPGATMTSPPAPLPPPSEASEQMLPVWPPRDEGT